MFLQDPLLDFKSYFWEEIKAFSFHQWLLQELSLRLEAAWIFSGARLELRNRSWQVSVPNTSYLFPGKCWDLIIQRCMARLASPGGCRYLQTSSILPANFRGLDCTYLLKNKGVRLMFDWTATLRVAVVSQQVWQLWFLIIAEPAGALLCL